MFLRVFTKPSAGLWLFLLQNKCQHNIILHGHWIKTITGSLHSKLTQTVNSTRLNHILRVQILGTFLNRDILLGLDWQLEGTFLSWGRGHSLRIPNEVTRVAFSQVLVCIPGWQPSPLDLWAGALSQWKNVFHLSIPNILYCLFHISLTICVVGVVRQRHSHYISQTKLTALPCVITVTSLPGWGRSLQWPLMLPPCPQCLWVLNPLALGSRWLHKGWCPFSQTQGCNFQ